MSGTTAAPATALRIFLVSGEPSGDALGAALMRGLRRRSPVPVVFAGVGGDRMAEEGLNSLFPQRDLAVMGFAEVVPQLRSIRRRWLETIAAIRAFRPDAVVTIDSSGFNKRIASGLIAAGERAPRIHFVAPMVWAWRPGRTHRMARLFDHLMTLLPFEPPSFEAAGLPTTFVGHPVVEEPPGDGPGFRRRHGIEAADTLVAVLPGSRPAEVKRLLPVFAQAIAGLAVSVPRLHVVLPTVSTVADLVEAERASWPMPATIVTSRGDKRDAFAASDAALAASGTVALELALADVPTVVAYKVQPMTAWLARRLVKLRHVSLANIILDRPVVPELLQDACTPENLEAELAALLHDPAKAAAQRAGFAELRHRLGDTDGRPPSERAADVVLSLALAGRGGQTPADVTPRNGGGGS